MNSEELKKLLNENNVVVLSEGDEFILTVHENNAESKDDFQLRSARLSLDIAGFLEDDLIEKDFNPDTGQITLKCSGDGRECFDSLISKTDSIKDMLIKNNLSVKNGDSIGKYILTPEKRDGVSFEDIKLEAARASMSVTELLGDNLLDKNFDPDTAKITITCSESIVECFEGCICNPTTDIIVNFLQENNVTIDSKEGWFTLTLEKSEGDFELKTARVSVAVSEAFGDTIIEKNFNLADGIIHVKCVGSADKCFSDF